MAKRYTDSEKWQDSWFTDLTNDQKIIWIYLLDHCDNAGLWKLNIKNLNYFCSTNISVEDLIFIFKERLTKVGEDLFLINKFCLFQYGPDFLNSKNKAVLSAINKLIQVGVLNKTTDNDTLSIGYRYPIDTPKEKDKDKDKEQDEYKDEVKELEKLEDKKRRLGWNNLSTSECGRYYKLKELLNLN
jgi:hypothetical protein